MRSPFFRAFRLRGIVLLFIGIFCLTIHAARAAGDDYLPIHEGNEWTMDLTIVAPDGTESKATGRRRVGEQVERNGKTYHLLRTWVEGGPAPFEYRKLMRKDETGVYTIELGGTDQKEQLEVKLPLKVGEEWRRTAFGVHVKEWVEAVESVKIGEKTYEKCYRIRTEAVDGSYSEQYWEAPHFGAVKSVGSGAAGKFTLTLREFKSGNQ